MKQFGTFIWIKQQPLFVTKLIKNCQEIGLKYQSTRFTSYIDNYHHTVMAATDATTAIVTVSIIKIIRLRYLKNTEKRKKSNLAWLLNSHFIKIKYNTKLYT